ncbi:uncharacterized protein EAF01_001687 [Botrytis porri]|uniref:Uncharacterized protein n=1 Tax=Botrytis porri TaxID=87229 RepID=A0A4Z1KF83_9HELO|nr:uncharacterized protein EAF01_001687 [Botrytis porri]KAF7912666.1 hypothetical protein EAF01_001687 [Botrytis porri]TGO84006.1 hypothetical protein BPOR_0563g00040 [Botrytis porri]
MSLSLFPQRGLNPREITALLIMVASQLLIGIMMLRMMMANQTVNNASVGFVDVLPTIQPSFEGANCDTQMHGKDSRNIDCSTFGKDAQFSKFNMGMGIDASEYLLKTKIVIAERIMCHRAFVSEKKNKLVKGLWEVIEGVYELEEMAAVANTDESASGANAKTSGSPHVFRKGEDVAADAVKEDWEIVKFAQNPAFPAEENNQFRTEISYMENRATGFRKAVEERMEKNDVEGALNMVRKSLKGLRPNEKLIGGEKSEGDSEEKMKMELAQKSKDKVHHALSGLWDIVQDMEEEMKDTERWLGETERAVKSAVREFEREWKI